MPTSKLGSIATALLLATFALSVSGSDAMAKSKKNISGSYNCYCLMGTGSCTMITEGDRVRCGKTATGGCTSSCRLDTTTSGVVGGAAARSGAAGKAGTKAAP